MGLKRKKKISASVSDKGLVPTIYKELITKKEKKKFFNGSE